MRAGDPLEDRDSRKDSSGSLFACGDRCALLKIPNMFFAILPLGNVRLNSAEDSTGDVWNRQDSAIISMVKGVDIC